MTSLLTRRLSAIIFLLCLFGNYSFTIPATSPQLSETARISLLTCSAGQELYSLFGHCALRVQDTALKIDKVYNYGTFDFNAADFYLNFVRGKLFYFLSVANFHTFKHEYIMANRAISEQVLNLTYLERQLLFNFLENNNLPQNRHYLYHYFLNNCATKIRDVLVQALQQNTTIQFKESGRIGSFRQLIKPYLQNRSWLNFGLYLTLGLPCDRTADTHERMFLPLWLENGFQEAYLIREGKSQPLIKGESELIQPSTLHKFNREWFTPHLLFWLLLAIVLLLSYFFEFRNNSHLHWLDMILFSLVGLVGTVLALLWVATDHDFAAYNLNLLWAMPFHLIFVFKLRRKKVNRSTRHYFFICGFICLMLLVFWPLNPQSFHSALIPLIILIAGRCLQIFRQKGRGMEAE